MQNEMAADEQPEAPQQTDKVCLTTCIKDRRPILRMNLCGIFLQAS